MRIEHDPTDLTTDTARIGFAEFSDLRRQAASISSSAPSSWLASIIAH